MDDRYLNSASGTASVGAQVGHMDGDLTISMSADGMSSTANASLTQQLHDLRAEFENAVRAGLIAAPLVAAARSSLDAADDAAASPQMSDRSAIARAIAMFREAAHGVTGLTTAAAAVIAAIHGAP